MLKVRQGTFVARKMFGCKISTFRRGCRPGGETLGHTEAFIHLESLAEADLTPPCWIFSTPQFVTKLNSCWLWAATCGGLCLAPGCGALGRAAACAAE